MIHALDDIEVIHPSSARRRNALLYLVCRSRCRRCSTRYHDTAPETLPAPIANAALAECPLVPMPQHEGLLLPRPYG
ncbi:hypothetical protein PF005_g3827 [Phytophthora fragariae]|uniref:Uncharacterized protein n=1 Tax=Phytophthora fragariae TaxID=53985 RepID=A0A6A3Z6N1_9STRA|nr:hypothetical protein PF005_g3827 [Phytophthora fragariae]KAE9324592.1 hypothetical protein PF001_g3367 [Phytophthora fragariae]